MTTAEQLVRYLIEKKLTVTTAESFTGGLIASSLIDVSGVSEVLKEAYITYSEEAKERLVGVRPETLEAYTVYSAEVASEMATGAARVTGADLALSSTGIAGPDGGSEKFPVGLGFLAVYFQGKTTTIRRVFHGDRAEIRRAATDAALELAFTVVCKNQ